MSTGFELIIEAAQAGDDAAARVLLGLLAEYLERGEVPPAEVREYFTMAFKKIAGRYKAEDALHTKGQGTTDQRDYDIARMVWWFNNRPVDPLPIYASGKHHLGAYDVVAKIYNLKLDSIKKIYLKMNKQFDLESCEPPMTPEESRKVEVGLQLALAKLAEILKKQGKD